MTKRGEIWWVDFNPSIGGEIQKIRPAIIISNNFSNHALNRVQVIPTTSNTERCYPCEAYVQILDKKSKAMADQIMTVSKKRLKSKISRISEIELLDIERIIKLQLGL